MAVAVAHQYLVVVVMGRRVLAPVAQLLPIRVLVEVEVERLPVQSALDTVVNQAVTLSTSSPGQRRPIPIRLVLAALVHRLEPAAARAVRVQRVLSSSKNTMDRK